MLPTAAYLCLSSTKWRLHEVRSLQSGKADKVTLWMAMESRHKRQCGPPTSKQRMQSLGTSQAVFNTPSLTRLKNSCSRSERGLWNLRLCCAVQVKNNIVQVHSASFWTFCSALMFAQSCGRQDQDLFRNGVAVNYDWQGKKIRSERCQQAKRW